MDPATEEAMGGADAAPGTGWGDLGQATVVDGVRLIAGGIESVLQRLQIQVYASKSATPDSLGRFGSCKVCALSLSSHCCQSGLIRASFSLLCMILCCTVMLIMAFHCAFSCVETVNQQVQ